mmetsp:Transcript_61891/g.128021  ORF Transcript_61891/g.128021 Transcript_61891/m.128021 type:complete len:222 (+) Transcript_61891:561-1226(+)
MGCHVNDGQRGVVWIRHDVHCIDGNRILQRHRRGHGGGEEPRGKPGVRLAPASHSAWSAGGGRHHRGILLRAAARLHHQPADVRSLRRLPAHPHHCRLDLSRGEVHGGLGLGPQRDRTKAEGAVVCLHAPRDLQARRLRLHAQRDTRNGLDVVLLLHEHAGVHVGLPRDDQRRRRRVLPRRRAPLRQLPRLHPLPPHPHLVHHHLHRHRPHPADSGVPVES